MYSTNNGDGGADVGGFDAALTVPTLLTFTNKDDLATIPRTSDLTVSWTGGDPVNELVVVFAFSDDGAGAEVSFFCVEQAAAGTLTVPATVLSSLPASNLDEGDNGLSLVGLPSRETSDFLAPGLDFGRFHYTDLVFVDGVKFE
jgi:hypothetical protein